MSEPALPGPEQELDVVSLPLSLLLIAATLVIVAGSVFWALGLERRESPRPAEVGLHLHPAPAVVAPERIEGVHQDPIDDEPGLAWRRSQEDMLRHYGWENEDAGVVRIPIDRAIDLRAAGHLPPPLPSIASSPARRKGPK